jgi:signal transduction histidine kinase/CheY-like chemotaxis protein
MGAKTTRWVNEQVDAVTRRTMPVFGVRVLIAAACAVLAAVTLGPLIAVFWGLAVASGEGGTWAATSRTRAGLVQTQRQRAIYLAAILWLNLAWSSLAVLLWVADRPGLKLAALCLLSAQMLHAQAFTARSRIMLLIVGGVPASTLLGLAMMTGDLPAVSRAAVIGGAVMTVTYMLKVAQANSRQAEEAEDARRAAVAANQAKSEFLALMSHELRTPMTGVLGMAQALKLSGLTEAQASQVDVMVRSGDALLELLNDILDIAKVEAGKLELEAAPFDFVATLSSIDALWMEPARARGLALAFEVDERTPRWLEGDAKRLRQILNNLLGNAIKFTSKGSVRLKVRGRDEGGRATIEIRVQDTGIGMNGEQVAKLFQPFSQGDASITRRFGGTGLGLSISQRLAQAMGGTITVESRPGQGSTFTVRLTLPTTEPIAAPQEAPAASVAGLRIAVVDDNAVNRQVLQTLLGALECEVSVAEDGLAALELLRVRSVDAVLMDIHMPQMGGEEALVQIRKLNLVPPEVPVVALTADVMREQVDRLRACGFAAVEAKPLNLDSLVATLDRLVSRPVGDRLAS